MLDITNFKDNFARTRCTYLSYFVIESSTRVKFRDRLRLDRLQWKIIGVGLKH